ncbi:MAG: hypothetical protein ACLU70_00245 [Lachnospira sp.]
MENNKVTYDELKNGLVANGLIANDSGLKRREERDQQCMAES